MAGFQVAEPQLADAYAQQLGNRITHGLEHQADLAFGTMIEHHLDAAGRQAFNRLCSQFTALSVNPFEKLVEVDIFKGLVGGDEVLLFHRFGRVHQALREVAVVG